MACLLDYDDPKMVPNFMENTVDKENGDEIFLEEKNKWLEENGLVYIEVSLEEYRTMFFKPLGLCTLLGKSPRGDWNHVVIGEICKNEEGNLDIHYRWDTSPYHDGVYLDGDIKSIGFLYRKL